MGIEVQFKNLNVTARDDGRVKEVNVEADSATLRDSNNAMFWTAVGGGAVVAGLAVVVIFPAAAPVAVSFVSKKIAWALGRGLVVAAIA